MSVIHSGPFSLQFKNEHTVYENEVHCLVKESEYNLSYNPTLVSGSYASGSLKDFVTGSSFHTYATAVGLYNDANELLAIAKTSQPIAKSFDKEVLIKVKLDF